MTDHKIIAFVATGDERVPNKGEYYLCEGFVVQVLYGTPKGPYPIFLPIYSDHPSAAAILAAVPKPLTLGERVIDEINRVKWNAVGHVIGDAQVVEIVNRLAAEGK